MSLIKDFISNATIANLVAESTKAREEARKKSIILNAKVIGDALTKMENQLKHIMETGEYPEGWGLKNCDCHGQEFIGELTYHYKDVDGDPDSADFRMAVSTKEAYVITQYKDAFLKECLPLVEGIVFENGRYMRNGYEIRLDGEDPATSFLTSALRRRLG